MDYKRIEILINYYSDMWKYRNKHFWWLVTMHIFVGIIIILFPFMSGKLEIVLPNQNNRYLFSIVGVIISGLFTYLLYCEAARMGCVSEKIEDVLSEMPDATQKRVKKRYRISLAKVIPLVIFIFHILIAVMYL